MPNGSQHDRVQTSQQGGTSATEKRRYKCHVCPSFFSSRRLFLLEDTANFGYREISKISGCFRPSLFKSFKQQTEKFL
jgi:hypothetical protein